MKINLNIISYNRGNYSNMETIEKKLMKLLIII